MLDSLRKFLIAVLFSAAGILGCDSSDVEDALDLADGVPRKTIDTSRLGVNAFVNDSRFGGIGAQFREVRDTLRLGFVRILFNWDDGVQSGPSGGLNFSFYDNIAAALPQGVDALVILTGLPSWMNDPANWTAGDPRRTFVERWVVPAVDRYRGNGRIIGFQIWNEPNDAANPNNDTLQVQGSPENYVEMLALAHSRIKDLAPGKLVVNAATTAINQNFPDSLDYNRAMRDSGARMFTDRWAAHYYGKQFENVLLGDGVADFLNGLGMSIWITESGAQGVNAQLAYGEQVWPFLIDNIPSVERIYAYQFAEATPADVTYGLKNLTGGSELSDLFIYLRDRA